MPRPHPASIALTSRCALIIPRRCAVAPRCRAELGLGDDYYQTSAGQRERLLQATDRLDKTSNRIQQGRQQLVETEVRWVFERVDVGWGGVRFGRTSRERRSCSPGTAFCTDEPQAVVAAGCWRQSSVGLAGAYANRRRWPPLRLPGHWQCHFGGAAAAAGDDTARTAAGTADGRQCAAGGGGAEEDGPLVALLAHPAGGERQQGAAGAQAGDRKSASWLEGWSGSWRYATLQ